MSRTRRFVGGLTLGYLHTIVVTIVALWLTPYLLRQLGQNQYGLWLLGAQVLVYLGLMDLGIAGLLPREVAYRTARDESNGALPDLVGETTALVLWQTPVVAVAGFLTWWLMPAEWSGLQWPLAIVIATFVLTFPMRIFPAVLQGIQDLPFLGATQLASWLAGTVLTVVLVEAGFGLYGLAAGWFGTQTVAAASAWWRLHSRVPYALPAHVPTVTLAAARARLARSVWISVSQVAQVLLVGTDLLVIGKLLGPAAIVPYVCTGKLITLLSNQPQLFMQMALPALSELRAGAPRDRLFQVSTGMAQAMLLGSGAIVSVVLCVNEPFVTWWVGESRFAGFDVTILLLAAMLLRHWNMTAVYTLFCFGYERWLALVTVVDGLVTLMAMLVLVPLIGIKGAVVGSIVGTCVVSLPLNLPALAREEGVPFLRSLQPLRGWAVRFGLFGLLVAAAASRWSASGFWGFTLAAIIVGVLYAAAMLPVVLGPPLGPMVVPRLKPWLTVVPGLSRRLAGQISPIS